MDWHTYTHRLFLWAWTRLPWPRRGRHARPSAPRPRARLALQAFEARESPTNLSGLAGAWGQSIDLHRWDSAELGEVATIAVMGPCARPVGVNGDGSTVGWCIGAPKAQAGPATTDIVIAADTSDSSATAVDDSLIDGLHFSTETPSPVLGAEPELGAASAGPTGMGGTATAWESGASVSAAAASFQAAAPTTHSASPGFIPPAANTSHTASLPSVVASAVHAMPSHAMMPAQTPVHASAVPTSVGAVSSTAPTQGTTSPQLSDSPFITTSSFPPDILPRLYSNTVADPANEPELTVDPSQGGDPMSVAFSQAGVRYADGAIQITASPDLSSDGFLPFGQTRSWSNAAYATTNINGKGWVDSQMPYLVQQGTGNTIALIASATNAYIFDLNNGTYVPRYFLLNTLTPGSGIFTFADDAGDTLTFNNFSTSLPTAERGTFKSLTDPYGNVTQVTAYNSNGQIQEIQSSSTVSGTTITELYLYTYYASGANAGLLENVTLRREVGIQGWDTVRQVVYTYYVTGSSYGNTGDLQTAVIEDASGAALQTWMYRYYTSNTAPGYTDGLEYVVDPRSYGRLAAAYSNPLTVTNTQLAPYAPYAIQYNSSKQASQVTVQGDGSSLVSSNVGLGTFTYTYSTGGGLPGYNVWSNKCVEMLPDGNQNTVYTNAHGEVMLEVYSSGGSNWLTNYQYDSVGRNTLIARPSAVASYSESNSALVTLNTSSGLIRTQTYASTTTATSSTAGDVAGYLQKTAVQQGSGGTSIEQESWQYILQTQGSDSVAPVATDTVFRNTNGTGGETTSYSYTWFTGTLQKQAVQVSLPVISSSENGPGTADVTTTYFDPYERPIWQKDPDGFLAYTGYDQATGAVLTHITDVDTNDTGEFTNLPSGWATPSNGGLNLIWSYQVDALGRDTKETSPANNVTYVTWHDPDHEERVYPGWNSSTNMPTGPTQVYRTDYPGSYTETLTMSATPHLTGGVPDGTEAISNVQTLSRDYTNIAGQVTREDAYFNLSGVTYSTAVNIGTLNTNYYEQTRDYDARGWLTREQSADGTITRIVNDGLDRVASIWVGTDDTPASGQWSPTNNTGPANMVQTIGYQYDNGGVGDSNLTQETDYPGGSQANRVTDVWYDWRDRPVAAKSGVEAAENDGTHRPIIFDTYDNLDEITQVQRYDGDGVTITVSNGVPQRPSASLLRAQTVTAFDDQERPYQKVAYDVNQSTGAVSSAGLTTNDYYDHRGDLVAEYQPGGLVYKFQFDGAGRQIEGYTTDGAGGTTWTAAMSVVNDNVLEQTDQQFDGDGNVIFVTTRQRDHNTTQTGALGNETISPKARVYYVAQYYDTADRLTDTVNVGTNGGSTYTRPSTVPADSATVLVTSQSYSAAGWVQDTVDPRGLDTRDAYDALGRLTQEIQDYTDGTPTNETNKTTNFTWDADGHMLTLQAVETGGASETTQWVYGVTTIGGSTINSNDMLATVEYPDPTTGAPSTSYEETYTVDALGENLTYTDRAGNVHAYSYDVLGRETADAITTLASGFDNSVLRIGMSYNALGDVYQVTTCNAASGGSVVNQVEDLYNGLNQLIQEYQSHSGAVVPGTTPSVQYAYNELAGGANNSRLVSMTYPNGRVLDYNYNTGMDSNISRLSSISDSSATLESYVYLGLDTVVERDHPQTNVNMTYISQTGSTGDAGDQYTGLDRFGRVAEVNWYNTSSHSSTDDFRYGFDQNNNVLYKNNMLDSAMSELYHTSGAGNGYDGLNQLTAFERGTLSASQQGGQLDTVSSPSTTESWALDALGNFTSVTTNGTQTNRTTNQQNEVTAVGSSNLAFDKNGNTTTDDQGHTLVYSAWNVLVEVKSGSTVLAAYGVNGLGQRVTENEGGTLTDVYFSSAWQVVEEDVSGSMTNQYVWSPVYVNAMIERDTPTQRLYVQQDANWNVTAVVSTLGTVVERYVYDVYGGVAYLTAGWGNQSGSNYGWRYLFQGGRLDPASQLYHFGWRDSSPSLQRWIQADPGGYAASGANLYWSDADAPPTNVDPSGEFIVCITLIVVGAAAGFLLLGPGAGEAQAPGLDGPHHINPKRRFWNDMGAGAVGAVGGAGVGFAVGGIEALALPPEGPPPAPPPAPPPDILPFPEPPPPDPWPGLQPVEHLGGDTFRIGDKVVDITRPPLRVFEPNPWGVEVPPPEPPPPGFPRFVPPPDTPPVDY